MRGNQSAVGNLGSCVGKTYQEIGQDFTRAYLGQGSPPYTEWELDKMHRFWRRVGKQVASDSKVVGR